MKINTKVLNTLANTTQQHIKRIIQHKASGIYSRDARVVEYPQIN